MIVFNASIRYNYIFFCYNNFWQIRKILLGFSLPRFGNQNRIGCSCAMHLLAQCGAEAIKKNTPRNSEGDFGDSAGARTQDPNIKSVVLYQLSYEIVKRLQI